MMRQNMQKMRLINVKKITDVIHPGS